MRHGGRTLQMIPFVESTIPMYDKIKKERYIKYMDLDFTADLVTSAGTTSGTIATDSVLRLFDLIEIKAGSKTIFTMDGTNLHFVNQHEYGTPPPLLVPTSDDEATYPIHARLRIDFRNNIGKYNPDTFLPAFAFNSLTMVIHFGAISSMIVGGDRVHAIASTFGITPYIYETTEAPDVTWLRIRSLRDDVIAASQVNYPIDVPKGNQVYQQMYFRTTDAGIRVADIINNITLKTEATERPYEEITFDELQTLNKFESGIETVPTGFANLPLLEDGLAISGLDTMGLQEPSINANVTVGAGATLIRTIFDHLEAYR